MIHSALCQPNLSLTDHVVLCSKRSKRFSTTGLSGYISQRPLNIFLFLPAAAHLAIKWAFVLLLWTQCIRAAPTSTSTEIPSAASTEAELYTGTTPELPSEPHHVIYNRLQMHTGYLQENHHATYTQFVSISLCCNYLNILSSYL